MQAIVLAAGHGNRLRPLTDTLPKPLIKVAGKTLLEYTLDVLVPYVGEFIVVIGYKSEKIREFLRDDYKNIPITYVEQPKREGTGHAVMLCKEHITGPFIMIYADEIIDEDSIAQLAREESATLTFKLEDPRAFGVIVLDDNMNVLELEEKPEKPKSKFVSAAAFKLTPEIFNHYPPPPKNGEYYLADMIPSYLTKQPMKAIIMKRWLTVNKPEDIVAAKTALKSKH